VVKVKLPLAAARSRARLRRRLFFDAHAEILLSIRCGMRW
jgi:hypothetical protein